MIRHVQVFPKHKLHYVAYTYSTKIYITYSLLRESSISAVNFRRSPRGFCTQYPGSQQRDNEVYYNPMQDTIREAQARNGSKRVREPASHLESGHTQPRSCRILGTGECDSGQSGSAH